METLDVMPGQRAWWQGRRVFITGHTGFKGTWLSLELELLGANVSGFALSPEPDSLYSASGLAGHFDETYGDLCDEGLVTWALAGASPEVVFHLAAQPLVRRSFREPRLTYETNVMGTVNLLEAVRKVPSVRAVVIITTDKCYKNREWEWGYREEDQLGGKDPYSSSKACTELVCEAWRSSFLAERGVSLATARAGNVIGGGDWAADRIVPDAIRAFSEGRELVIRSQSSVRPWQHVLEPLSGYVLLAERLAEGEADCARAWNFGPAPQDELTVGELASELAVAWGEGASWRSGDGTGAAGESGLLMLDASLAARRLGVRPRLNVRQAVAWTVEWYQRVRNGELPCAVTVEQIRRYRDLLACGDEG